MNPKVRQWTAIVAAAAVLAYVGTAAVTEVRDFALWPTDLTSLSAFAAICGGLLALTTKGSFWPTVAASLLAALIVAGLGIYIFWSFLGEYFSVFEIIASNLFVLHVLPRSAVVFLTATFVGLLGTVAVAILFPSRYLL